MFKKMSKFYKVYLIVVASLIVLLIAGSTVLWMFLGDFEETRPKYVAQQIFDKYFDLENITELVDVAQAGNGFESKELVVQGVNEKLAGKELALVSVAVGDDGNEKFAVTADGIRVATFTVSKSGEKQGFGIEGCKLGQIELYFGKGISKTILVPQGYNLFINGIAVADEFVTQTEVAHYSNDYLPEGEQGLYMNEYTVSGFFYEPEIVAKTEQGEQVSISVNNTTQVLSAELLNDVALQEEYSQYAIKIASTYAAVMSEDTPKSQIYKYMDKSSEFYQKIKKSAVSWFWDHDGYKIKDAEATRFYRHSEDVFSCRVTLKQELYLGKTVEVVNLDLVLYLRKIDGEFLLYNALTNG